MVDVEDYLAHYGVLGMKWGVRKDRSRSYSSDYARTRKIRARAKKKGTENLSNDDLQKVIKRKELERKYAGLNPSAVKAGYQYLTGALAVLGTGVAIYNLANSPAGRAGKEWLKKMLKVPGSYSVKLF